MENKELIGEEVIEEIVPVTTTLGKGVKKVGSYCLAGLAGAFIAEFGIKPIWKWIKEKRVARKKAVEEESEYYDEPQD